MRDRAWACRAPCFAFDDFPFITPSVTVMISAADESTTRDGRLLAQASRHVIIRRKWTGLVCEVKSLQAIQDATACDGLTTTAAAAVAAGRCWSCLSARADSLHGHV